MNRTKRNWAFWILVFSLSLAPLAASGGDCNPDFATCVDANGKEIQPKKAPSDDLVSKPGDVLPSAPVAVKAAPKKVVVKKIAAKPAAPAPAQSQVDALSTRVSGLENGQKAIASDLAEIKKAVTHQDAAKPGAPVQTLAKQERSTVTSASSTAVTSGGVLSDLSFAELSQTFGSSFEIVHRGSGSSETVYLEARVFDDCAHFFQITSSIADGACGGSPTFRVTDIGGEGRKCIENLKSSHHTCSDSDDACKDLSTMNAPLSLAGASDHSSVQMLHRTLEETKNNRNKCETLGVEHRTAQGIDDDRKAARAAAAYKALAGPCRNVEDLAIKLQATESLALMGYIDPAQQERTEKSLQNAEFAMLKKRALHPKASELEEIASDLNTYTSDHPESCKKLVSAYQNVSRAFVARSSAKKVKSTRRHRGDEDQDDDDSEPSNPLDGYELARGMLHDAMSNSCYEDNQKMADMDTNLELNSVEKDFEINGSQNMETYAHYYELMGEMQSNVMDTCSGFNVGMECYTEMRSYQNASTLPTYGYETDRRRAQSQMAMQQLMMQSAGGGMMNATAMNGMPGGMQIPGSAGGTYGGSSNGSFGFGRF